MKQVPIIRITEMLATSYGILAQRVVVCSSPLRMKGVRYQVDDVAGRRWWLQAEEAGCSRRVVIGMDAMPQPTLAGDDQQPMLGLYWTVSAMPVGMIGPTRTEPDPGRSARTVTPVSVEDTRALDSVGAWLAQPAGLLAAQDLLGQTFLDHWHRSRPQIAAWHRRAEALHDRIVREHGRVQQAGTFEAQAWSEWQTCCCQLHELLELQQCLLGPKAPQLSTCLRLRSLERFAQVLDDGVYLPGPIHRRQAQAG